MLRIGYVGYNICMSELPIRYWILNLKNIILVVFTTRLYTVVHGW